MTTRISVSILVAGATLFTIGAAGGATILSPAGFTAPTTIVNYEDSPVGELSGGTSITTQYATIGVIHDGSTTTPPGPLGIGSISGLQALESNTLDPDPDLPISITFTTPVSQVGAFYLMALSLTP